MPVLNGWSSPASGRQAGRLPGGGEAELGLDGQVAEATSSREVGDCAGRVGCAGVSPHLGPAAWVLAQFHHFSAAQAWVSDLTPWSSLSFFVSEGLCSLQGCGRLRPLVLVHCLEQRPAMLGQCLPHVAPGATVTAVVCSMLPGAQLLQGKPVLTLPLLVLHPRARSPVSYSAGRPAVPV